MQLSSLLPLALLTTLVSAAAIPAAEPEIINKDWKKREALPMANAGAFQEKRAATTVGGIFICTDINFGGTCGYKVQPLNTCIILGSDWNDLISSFGPDQGTTCALYIDTGCSGASVQLSYPGSADLRNQGVNDLISSFYCWAG